MLRRSLLGVLITALLVSIASWALASSYFDPYIQATLKLQGSAERGNHLFKMNCVGCHGIKGQGFLGPDLHEVNTRYSDSQIINQVLKGRTPPMPSFQMEPQAMSDLIAYLQSLS